MDIPRKATSWTRKMAETHAGRHIVNNFKKEARLSRKHQDVFWRRLTDRLAESAPRDSEDARSLIRTAVIGRDGQRPLLLLGGRARHSSRRLARLESLKAMARDSKRVPFQLRRKLGTSRMNEMGLARALEGGRIPIKELTLGGSDRVVWAAFPDDLDLSNQDVGTVLARLGLALDYAAYVCWEYDSRNIETFCPTVLDADGFEFFSPSPPSEPTGLTCPTLRGVGPGLREVVHAAVRAKITGRAVHYYGQSD